MFTDPVDILHAFVQGNLLPGDGHNGNVCISSSLGYEKDPRYVYRLLKPLYENAVSCLRMAHDNERFPAKRRLRNSLF